MGANLIAWLGIVCVRLNMSLHLLIELFKEAHQSCDHFRHELLSHKERSSWLTS